MCDLVLRCKLAQRGSDASNQISKKAQSPSRPKRQVVIVIRSEIAQEGEKVSVSQLCLWTGLPQSAIYYQVNKCKPKINKWLAAKLKTPSSAL
ncbi:hypothetical protein [Vibrio neptunius]|uniref:Transposase n=1 Tax=Vibrio neptunius TaxID=170651 RepID=A0ABS3A376_9VIBR|nr:hypothetical protein [Vibrio neptunius]MBN3493390.1 hypothetical protein [Vibrio neptunius]MBN3515916.1 hypothetical protein [Vibrio neptunius]MBN3550059.1 hypothetical protein [Vibrio neptunius]MBN3578221.1 hypothetical protein [Vibrio neptunius]MCH9871885.1 hypothetical protein [Vibrio neptunius]